MEFRGIFHTCMSTCLGALKSLDALDKKDIQDRDPSITPMYYSSFHFIFHYPNI